MVRRAAENVEEPVNKLVTTRVRPLDKREAASRALGMLTGKAPNLPVVEDRGRPFGIVVARTFMKRTVDPHARLERYTLSTGYVEEDTPIREVARVLADRDAPFMPVAHEGGKLAGAVTANDVLRELPDVEGEAGGFAREVPLLSRTETLGNVIHAFHGVNAPILPVMDEDGRVEGVVDAEMALGAIFGPTRRPIGWTDFAMAEDRSRLDLPVHDFMASSFETVPPAAREEEFLEALEDRDGIVVASGSDVRGVLTPLDVLRALRPREMAEGELRIVPKREARRGRGR